MLIQMLILPENNVPLYIKQWQLIDQWTDQINVNVSTVYVPRPVWYIAQ